MSKFALKALGGESGKFLSHAKNEVWLQTGNQGVGEVFNIIELPKGRVALACLGKEKGKYLSHAFAKLWLHKDGIKVKERNGFALIKAMETLHLNA